MAAKLMPVDEAVSAILAQALPPPDTDSTPIISALGKVLARDVVATIDVPPCANSAMDGYAVRAIDLDLKANPDARLKVSQRIAAGQCGSALEPGTAARIFTGAPMPPGADAVVMQEDTRQEDETILVTAPVTVGQHVRPAGQDIAAGARVIAQGRRLQPQDIGVLASIGVTEVDVYRPLKVAVVSTGDELVEPGEALTGGRIYNSNRYTLSALLSAMGFQVIDGGIVADNLDATCEQLENLARQADVVMSSGGVSVGEEDHVKGAVDALGRLSLWKLNIKPGKPLAFGFIECEERSVPFIGLPGNPSSVFVTFSMIARPFLWKSQGRSGGEPIAVEIAADFDWIKPGSRQEYLRARVKSAGSAQVVELYGNQSSGVLLSTSWANALVVIPPQTVVRRGDSVSVLLLSELMQV